MIFALYASLVLIGQASDTEVDGKQFGRLMQGLHGDIQDVSLVFEGNLDFLGPDSWMKGKPEKVEFGFQGTYAYRNDGSRILERYDIPASSDDASSRKLIIGFDGQYKNATILPDSKNQVSFGEESQDSAMAFVDLASPERILYLAYFRKLEDPVSCNYQYQGWEDVDGHRCLRVQLDFGPGSDPQNENRPYLRFWIDVTRGGHPLKVEFFWSSSLQGRVENIQLDRFQLPDGKEVWFPVRGEDHSFIWEGESLSRPTFRETYAVVTSSVQFNQGLKDERFSEFWKGTTFETPELKRTRDIFDSTPPFRTDPAGVQERLDKWLIEADKQSEQLEASSSARAPWKPTAVLQVGFTALGLCLIAGAAYWRWRKP